MGEEHAAAYSFAAHLLAHADVPTVPVSQRSGSSLTQSADAPGDAVLHSSA
jgi:hypothetical protein